MSCSHAQQIHDSESLTLRRPHYYAAVSFGGLALVLVVSASGVTTITPQTRPPAPAPSPERRQQRKMGRRSVSDSDRESAVACYRHPSKAVGSTARSQLLRPSATFPVLLSVRTDRQAPASRSICVAGSTRVALDPPPGCAAGNRKLCRRISLRIMSESANAR